MALDINPSEFKDDEIENRASASGILPKGWYVACLQEAAEDEYNGKTRSRLTFEIIKGQYDGRKVFHDLYHSSDSSDKAHATVRACLMYWAKRLGLVTKAEDGTLAYVDGKTDFPDVVGASVAIEIVPSTYKDKHGNEKERNELSMYGIKTIDEWEASEAEKAKGGSGGKPKRGGGKSTTSDALPGMAGASSPDTAASGTATATSKTDDFSDM